MRTRASIWAWSLAGLVGLSACTVDPVGIQTAGELTAGDRALATDGSPYDVYRFSAVEGSSIRVIISSDEFSPYLWVFGPDGAPVISTNGLGSSPLNVLFPVPVSGSYSVFVNSAYTEEECREEGCSVYGAYGLIIREETP